MSPELKALVAALASYLASNKTEGEALVSAFLDKELGYGESLAESAIGKISNPFLKAAAEWVYSTYKPDFSKWLASYEGDAYDALVSYLESISK